MDVTPIINGCIQLSHFPDELKMAECASLFRSSDCLPVGDYHPVNILTYFRKFSKVHITTSFMFISAQPAILRIWQEAHGLASWRDGLSVVLLCMSA